MNVDDFVKITLALSFAFAIIGISFQAARLLGSLTDSIKAFRKTIINIGELSERLIEDYEYLSEQIRGLSESIGLLRENTINPIINVTGFIKDFLSKVRPQETEDE